MEFMVLEDWKVLSSEEQEQRKEEKPLEVRVEEAKEEGRKNALAEEERKGAAAKKQIEELNTKVKDLEDKDKPAASVEEYKRTYLDLASTDLFDANRKLALDAVRYGMKGVREADKVRRITLRKLRKDFKDDFPKYADELEDMLDGVTDPAGITEKSIQIMFDSLRGQSVEDRIKEAEQRGANKALEDAGVIAIGEGAGGGAGSGEKGKGKSTLTKEQQEEMERMLLDNEVEYLELLKGFQEKDKLAGKPPRRLINMRQ